MSRNKISLDELDARLLSAIRRGSLGCAERLIANGASVERLSFSRPPSPELAPRFLSLPARAKGLGWDYEPGCPLIAAANSHGACRSLVWRLAPLHVQKRTFFYALWIFSRSGLAGFDQGPLAEVLATAPRLKIDPSDVHSEFSAAARRNLWSYAAALLPLVDPNAPLDDLGMAPLMAIATRSAASGASIAVFGRFLDLCDPSALDREGSTLLMAASRHGLHAFVEELLSRGVGGCPLAINADGLDARALAELNPRMSPRGKQALVEAMAMAESRAIQALVASPEAPRRRSCSL